jgi:hypothetical protein
VSSLLESVSSSSVRVQIHCSTARPRPNITVTKCKVAAFFPPLRSISFSLRRRFVTQSPKKGPDRFWVAIIAGIATQETVGKPRGVSEASNPCSKSSLNRESDHFRYRPPVLRRQE